jgi:hypothetical protein
MGVAVIFLGRPDAGSAGPVTRSGASRGAAAIMAERRFRMTHVMRGRASSTHRAIRVNA